MKERIISFIGALRQAGISPSLGESLDAVAAIGCAGIERRVLRESLAATLVKDHADRATFDEVFDRHFALPVRARRKAQRHQRVPESTGAGGTGEEGAGRGLQKEGALGIGEEKREEQRVGEQNRSSRSSRELAQRRAIASLPFRDMDPRQVEMLGDLVEELGRRFRRRCARRVKRASRGRLDMRRTIRRALSRGGVPIELLLRHPRPGKSDLVALVDLSFSTATAAAFLLALLAPARPYFRRLTLVAYVDAPAEISFERGHIVPHEPLDLNARSDFGNVLRRFSERYEVTLGRNSVLLILGDARNNRRPPRADILKRLRQRVRSVVWLNPEPAGRWNAGDSVMSTYARHVDILLAAHDAKTLVAALAELAKVGV